MENKINETKNNFLSWIKDYQWDAEQKSKFYSNRVPLEKEVFNIEKYEYAELFIRELVQNALDAKNQINNEPVSLDLEILDFSLAPHRNVYNRLIDTKILGLLHKSRDINPKLSLTYKVLRISDNNTTGLSGEIINEKSNWYKYFIKIGNLTDLSKNDSLGSANLGKVAIWMCSNLWMVFARTCVGDKKFRFQGRCLRSANTPDENDPNIINSCDVFFRKEIKDDVAINTEKSDDLSKLLLLPPRTSRGTDFIFPEFKSDTLEKDQLISFTLKNWFKAIAENRARINIFGEELSSETYKVLIEKYGTRDKELDLDMIQFAVDASNSKCDEQFSLKKSNTYNKYKSTRALSQDFFEDEKIDEKLLIKDLQKNGKHIQIKVPVKIKTKKANFENDYFLISLKKRSNKNGMSTFGLMFRNDQILWEEYDFYKSSNIEDLMICVISSTPMLNKLLTHFEEPSHLKFNNKKFTGADEFDRSVAEQVLYLFRNVANKFIEFLIKENEEIDSNALSDIFPTIDINKNDDDDDDSEIEDPDDPDKPDDPDDPDKPDPPPPPPPPPTSERLITPFQKEGLYKLSSISREEIIGKRIKITFGVRSLGGKNAFKNANRFLIDLTEVTFTDYEGCDIDTSSIKFNSFELIALESSFNITIEGLHPSYAYASRYVILEEDL